MSFETAADAFIRPAIGPAATPAHAVAESSAASSAKQATQQAAWLSQGAAREHGAKADFETGTAELSFYDLLDVINPLQHIPGIAQAYRALTGDEIKPPAQILGGALFGGPVGLVAAVANAAIKESSGHDIGEAALALLFGDEPAPSADVAAATPEQPPALEAQLQPAAGPAYAIGAGPAAASGYTVGPGPATGAQITAPQLVDEQAPALPPQAPPEALPARAAAPQETISSEPSAATAPEKADATEGPVLTGKAALNAFLNDLAKLGRSAEGAAPAPAATEATLAEAAPEAPASKVPASKVPASKVPANLVGLGGRDRRPIAQRAPAVIVPAERLTGATRPAAASAPSHPAAPTGPRLPGGAAPDPTLFTAPPAENASGAGAPGSAAAAPSSFSAEMMRALQKYETMMQNRGAATGDPG